MILSLLHDIYHRIFDHARLRYDSVDFVRRRSTTKIQGSHKLETESGGRHLEFW
jgi:hypothetical protein